MAAGKLKPAKCTPLGEGAVRVSFGSKIDPQVHRSVRAFAFWLAQHPFEGMIEFIEAFTSVTIFYEPSLLCKKRLLNPDKELPCSYQIAVLYIREMLKEIKVENAAECNVVRIPVCYGGKYGPDLADVARYHKMTEEEVIELHQHGDYLVYMIGFAPGFPYVGGLPKAIATPRRKTPRLVIPQGSVGIAGEQTGVYPLETPGGWQLIGRTPLPLFRPDNTAQPSLLKAGDRLEFYAISEAEYEQLAKGEVNAE